MPTLKDKMKSFEAGELFLKEEFIDFFQELITTGLVWKLQCYYVRVARFLIKTGQCHEQIDNITRSN